MILSPGRNGILYTNVFIFCWLPLKSDISTNRCLLVGLLLISAKQFLLPSRGTTRLSRLNENENGEIIRNETTKDRKSTALPITEFNAEINFFWDHSTRINLGYAYSHWNFYEIQGFGRSNFQNLSFSGPRLSLNYHF